MNRKKSDTNKFRASNPKVVKVPILLPPGKKGTDSPKTPEAKHIEKPILPERRRGNLSSKFRGNSGYNVKRQPGTCILPSDLLWLVNEEVGSFIKVSYKKSENNIDSEESIDNIIGNGEWSLWFL